MNYDTTNDASSIVPYSTTYICNPRSYSCNCLYDSNISDAICYAAPDFLTSSDKYRRKAVDAIYKMGYITKDEADSLVNDRYAKRNDCTTIFTLDEGTKIVIYCTERTGYLETETLFKLSYDKVTDNVTEDKRDLLEEIN